MQAHSSHAAHSDSMYTPLVLPGQGEEGKQFQRKQYQPEHLFIALQSRGQKHRRENSRVKAQRTLKV